MLWETTGLTTIVQISDFVADALTASAGPRAFFRRVGLGIVRKDLSTPLEPRLDQIWFDDPLGDAGLFFRSSLGVARFRLGAEPESRRAVYAAGMPKPLIICVGGYLLPDSHYLQLEHEQAAARLWGGLVGIDSI